MAQVPSQVWTPYDVLSTARELASTADQKKVMSEQGRAFYRLAISEIVALLNSTADPSYWESAPLTITADQENLSDTVNSGGTITSINASTSTIVRSTGSFTVGSVLAIAYGDVAASTGAIVEQFIVRITSSGASATFTLLSGTAVTFNASAHSASVQVLKSQNLSTSDISGIRYDRVVAVQSSTAGFCIPVTPHEFFSVDRPDFPNKSYDDDIVYTQLGNKLYFKAGSKIVGGLGVLTMFYQRQPNYPATDAGYTSNSEFVDLADKWMYLLVKRIYTLCILQTENDIPKNLAQEMALDYQAISTYAGSELQNKMKQELNQRAQ